MESSGLRQSFNHSIKTKFCLSQKKEMPQADDD